MVSVVTPAHRARAVFNIMVGRAKRRFTSIKTTNTMNSFIVGSPF